jgi:NitT/TauT family transport system ATP-binding protein
MSDPFLLLDDVSLTFADGDGRDHRYVLSDVSLAIPGGAFVALVGASGVGKSTLLRIIAGLLTPTSGFVRLADGSPEESPPSMAMRDTSATLYASLGIVFQRDNLMPWRTVADNVRLPLELGHWPPNHGKSAAANRSDDERVEEVLQLVGLGDYAQAYPAQLSGGMAQRVAIARSLVHQPSLLLLDEPFGALDALTREKMGEELLRIWQARPVTVLMVTHSIGEAVLLADEVLVMNGRPATITDRFQIDLPRPRNFEMQRTAAFQDYAAAVRGAIRTGD